MFFHLHAAFVNGGIGDRSAMDHTQVLKWWQIAIWLQLEQPLANLRRATKRFQGHDARRSRIGLQGFWSMCIRLLVRFGPRTKIYCYKYHWRKGTWSKSGMQWHVDTKTNRFESWILPHTLWYRSHTRYKINSVTRSRGIVWEQSHKVTETSACWSWSQSKWLLYCLTGMGQCMKQLASQKLQHRVVLV